MEVCETCEGSGREMIDYGNGDVRDVECSMCKGERTKAAFDRSVAEINAAVSANPHETTPARGIAAPDPIPSIERIIEAAEDGQDMQSVINELKGLAHLLRSN